MDIETIRERIRVGNYLVKGHVILHALKEGFDRNHIIEAIFNGAIIEEYQDDRRVLICGRSTLTESVSIYLHIVCEYSDPIFVELITAYIPDENHWERPAFLRRKRKRK